MTASLIWTVVATRAGRIAVGGLAVLCSGALLGSCVSRAASNARIDRLDQERDRWQASAEDWRRAFHESETLRAGEVRTAGEAAAALQAACEGRVRAARRSAQAIETIVTQETPRDANGCPDRRLVPVERLRDALSPGA